MMKKKFFIPYTLDKEEDTFLKENPVQRYIIIAWEKQSGLPSVSSSMLQNVYDYEAGVKLLAEFEKLYGDIRDFMLLPYRQGIMLMEFELRLLDKMHDSEQAKTIIN